MKEKKVHQKKSTKSTICRGGITTIYSLILKGHTKVADIIRITGRSKRSVDNDLRKLVKKGVIFKEKRGIYKVHQKSPPSTMGSHPEVHHFSKSLKSENTEPYFSLHNIQVQLLINDSVFKSMRSQIYNDRKFFKLDKSGTTGDYFEYVITGMVTKQNIFIFFPADFEVTGETQPKVIYKFDQIMQDLLQKWGLRFAHILYKVGRINYEIVNQHWAIVDNGIAKEYNDNNWKVKTKDSADGKTALMIDASDGFNHFESPHATKSPYYISNAHKLINRVRTGEAEQIFDDMKDMKQIMLSFGKIADVLMTKLSPPEPEAEPENYVRPIYIG